MPIKTSPDTSRPRNGPKRFTMTSCSTKSEAHSPPSPVLFPKASSSFAKNASGKLFSRRKRAEKLFHQEAGSDYIDRIVEQTASRSLLSFVDRRIRIRACHQNRTGKINDAVLQIARRRFR